MQFWEGGINIPLFGKPNIEKMKQEQDFKGLCKALGHKDKEVSNQAVKALMKILRAVLANKDWHYSAMDVLGKTGGAVVVPLIAILNDKWEDLLVRKRVILVLGEIRNAHAFEHLIEVLKDTKKDSCLRSLAAKVLGSELPVEHKALARQMKLGEALVSGNMERVKILLKEEVGLVNTWASPYDICHEGMKALSVAVTLDQADMVELLIAQKAEVNAHDLDEFTALHHARSIEVANLLIAHGAEVNAETQRVPTPLYYAAGYGLRDLVELLLVRGAEVNGGMHRSTPLINAVRGGHLEVVRLLLDHGARVNVKDERGWTPLHAAASFAPSIFSREPKSAAEEMTKLLLAHGADVHAKTRTGDTPLSLILPDKTKGEVAKILRQHEDVLASSIERARLSESPESERVVNPSDVPNEVLDFPIILSSLRNPNGHLRQKVSKRLCRQGRHHFTLGDMILEMEVADVKELVHVSDIVAFAYLSKLRVTYSFSTKPFNEQEWFSYTEPQP